MKRRGFLQSLAGFVGLAIAPTLPAKTKPTIVNLPPQIIETGIVDNSFNQFDHLTIDHFGAGNTKSLESKDYIPGMTWYSSSEYFPPEATTGDAFYFQPNQYHGYQLDDKTKNRLTGAYVFVNDKWFLIATHRFARS